MVNKVLTITKSGRARARAILRETPIDVDLIGLINGKQLLVEYKRTLGAADAWQAVQYARDSGASVLVVAEKSTASARDILSQNKVSLVDALGNARLAMSGMFVRQEVGNAPEPRRQARLSGKAGVIAQALMLEPKKKWHVTEVAQRSAVSTALAHRVLVRLQNMKLVSSEGVGPARVRWLSDPAALLDLWTGEERERGVRRIRLHRLARTPQELVGSISTALTKLSVGHAVTGAAAATLRAPLVTSVPVADFWVEASSDMAALTSSLDGSITDDGYNVVLQQTDDDTPLAFKNQEDSVWLANPLRIYRDLLLDPRRGREQAERVRRAAIGF